MKRIGELLVDNCVISQNQLEEALVRQNSLANGMKIGEILIDMGYLTYDGLLSYLDTQITT